MRILSLPPRANYSRLDRTGTPVTSAAPVTGALITFACVLGIAVIADLSLSVPPWLPPALMLPPAEALGFELLFLELLFS